MKPLGLNVLIQMEAPDTGVIQMITEPELPNTGVVLDVGSKVMEVTEGDRVMIRRGYTTAFVPDHDDLLVVPETEILLILS